MESMIAENLVSSVNFLLVGDIPTRLWLAAILIVNGFPYHQIVTNHRIHFLRTFYITPSLTLLLNNSPTISLLPRSVATCSAVP